MKTYIIIILFSLLVLLLARAIIKIRTREESQLSIFDHPATFKKPDIEMVNKTIERKEETEKSFQIDPKEPDDKNDREK